MQLEQPEQTFCIACYSENHPTSDRCSKCGYTVVLRYPAPNGMEEAALLPRFMRADASDAWPLIQRKLRDRDTWLSPAAQECVTRFAETEMDYTTPSDRGLGRMSAYISRLAAWKRSDIERLSSEQQELLRSFIIQLILAGYGNHLAILINERSVHRVPVERLYEAWVPTMYGADYGAILPEDVRREVSYDRRGFAGIFQYQYEKVLRLRIGLFGKVKFGTIAFGYFDAGALLAHTEWQLASESEAHMP